ncbi:fimbrial assembly protein [Cellulomonas pakistanensis]|uniref:Fimbrial assembly protein n=1 Tax=Cellulomonas pakistanensis TaxID=992287 RepID=A0A919U5K9_9CELL|nr:fimbrial assembly protein [Cellulomonas pakistanensis]GIG35112.1 hypothetical protein Cpa01nite_04930 [Cellulomonas pakistanensis]
MTAISERKATPAAGVPQPAPYIAPRVNLLPPEIYGARAMGRVKRVLALCLVLVVAVAAGGYALFSFALSTQEKALADADAETMRLTAAQQQYAEVPVVLNRLEQLEAARQQGMSTETLWREYLGYVFAAMPGGVKVASLTVDGATPMLAPAAPADPLQAESVSRLDMTAVSDTLPNIAQWQDQLDTIPGFDDVRVTAVTVGEDTDTATPRFEFSVSVQVTDEAYANRFLPNEDEG